MQSEIFKLKTATSEESINNTVRVPTGIEGVSAVTASLFHNELSTRFDAQLASKQSLQAVLQGAGTASKRRTPAVTAAVATAARA